MSLSLIKTSNTRSEQSRINGAKSKGPITPTGKAASSRNALKHGLTAEKHTVLDIENPAEYKIVYDAAIDEFRPHSLFALRMVEKLANLDWRIERLAMLETAYLNFKVNESANPSTSTPEMNPFLQIAEGTGEIASLVRGWISAVGSLNALDLLRRYSGTLQHQFNTTFANFQKLETRAVARSRDRNLDPNFLPPYEKPQFPEPPEATEMTPSETPQPTAAKPQAPAPAKRTQPKPTATATKRLTPTAPTSKTPLTTREIMAR